jgi:uncharacterized oxidoreductase
MKLEQKRVLVTGGTAGIGRALTQLLVERGARVFICGRDSGRLEATLGSLPGVGGLACDVARAEELPALMAQAVEQLGGLDLLVNNAGIQLSWDLGEGAAPGPEALARVSLEVATNLVAPIALTFLALPHLRRGAEPAIVNVTSVLAAAPKPSSPVYSATKAALRSFGSSMRRQLAGSGVRVVEVVPPLVDTAMTRGRSGLKTISPELMASAIVDGLRADKTRILVGKARVAAILQRWAPGLLEDAMARG